MDTPTPRPPPLPGHPDRAPLAVAALVLGLFAVLLSPVLVGVLPGIVGGIVALVHLRRSRERRALAGWGLGLSAAGAALALAWGGVLATLIWRAIPSGTMAELRPAAAAADMAAADAQATYAEDGVLADQGPAKAAVLSTFCLDAEDRLLACDEEGRCIRLIAPDGTLVATWPLDFWPQAIAWRGDGSVVVAGGGRVAVLGAEGQVLASTSLPAAPGIQPDNPRARFEAAVTAVAATGEDIFACTRAGMGYSVFRLDARLDNATPIIRKLRGCCGQLDMTARDGVLYVAANADFAVKTYDREGKALGSFGRSGKGPEFCFDGCCEPKNLAFGPDGSLFLAGSGKCAISRYTADGQFLEYVGRVTGISGCVRVTLAVNHDASRVYMLDTDRSVVRVLSRREPSPILPAEPSP